MSEPEIPAEAPAQEAGPDPAERRRTRIVFPSSREAHVWKIVGIAVSAWAAWMTARTEIMLRQAACTPAPAAQHSPAPPRLHDGGR